MSKKTIGEQIFVGILTVGWVLALPCIGIYYALRWCYRQWKK